MIIKNKSWKQKVIKFVKWLIRYKDVSPFTHTVDIVQTHKPIITIHSECIIPFDVIMMYQSKENLEQRVRYQSINQIATELVKSNLVEVLTVDDEFHRGKKYRFILKVVKP